MVFWNHLYLECSYLKVWYLEKCSGEKVGPGWRFQPIEGITLKGVVLP